MVAGLAAYVFRLLIAVFHNLLLLGKLSASYDTNAHTPPSPWGLAVVLVPAVAALLVVFLVDRWAPEAKGHGVPEIMDAIYYRAGFIRPIVGLIKSIASALSIGSGGSVGREGPIAQIGAAFGSWVGRFTHASRWQVVTLVAAGGGAGIAATFNTPIGGVLFAAEVLMSEISVRTLVPVTLATATATFVGRWLFGNHPAFSIPPVQMPATTKLVLLPAYAVLGVLAAAAAALFIKTLYATEDRLEARIRNDYLRHVLGMLGVGILMVILQRTLGHYYVEGVGYAGVMDVLLGTLANPWVLLLLFALKLASTCLTLGSGASGGVFSPSLFIGATIGGAYGIALHAIFPGLELDPTSLALAGMAGMVAGTTGAALTAIVMIFEMTLDYSVVLPMTLTVAVAHGLRQRLIADSIYTLKLTRRGHLLPRAMQAAMYFAHQLGSIPRTAVATLPGDAAPARLDQLTEPYAVIVEGDHVTGVIERARLDADRARGARSVADLANVAHVVLPPDSAVATALVAARQADAVLVVVARRRDALGVVTRAQLADAVADELAVLAD
ncbi:MAG TPA: chloride channel protein [Kofleriaceae bacterium]|nr:chloride channel protein [Kofleriaceae bacterium]